MIILLLIIFFCSGVAGLGYQLLWTRMFTTGLGHEMPSMLAVVAAFFGGLALGAWLLDGRIARSARPGMWYAGLEAAIAAWAFVTIALIPLINTFAPKLIGIDAPPAWHWLIAFVLPFLALLPATVAMGATLPAMERFIAPMMRQGRSIGALYAANTAGAVAGTLLGAFVLGPRFGLSVSVMMLAAVNLLCAAATLFIARSMSGLPKPPLPPPEKGEGTGNTVGLTTLLFLTGLLGIGFETLAIRAMAQVLENTVYSYAAALTIFLAGTAIGAAIYQRFGSRVAFDKLLVWLLALISAGCLIGVWQLDKAAALYAMHRSEAARTLAAVFRSEMLVAAGVLLLPTLAMGATFSHLVQACKRQTGGVGRATAINTFGAALAPLLFVVLLLPVPAIGVVGSLIIASLAYIPLMLIPLMHAGGPHWLAPLLPLAMLPAALGTSLRPGLDEHDTAAGARIVEYREGVIASVAVLESDAGRTLQVNNRFNMGGTSKAAVVIQRCQGHIPLLLHPNPKSALFLGTATGITMGAATVYPDLHIDGVELLPEVVDVMRHFQPHNAWPYDNAKVSLHVADARRFVRATPKKYDVIVADLFHPAADGAGMLYTVEHFRAVRERLEEGGLFCQWLPLHQLDEATLATIIRSYLGVFPQTHAFMADFNIDLPVVALIAGDPRGPALPHYGDGWYAQRLAPSSPVPAALRSQAVRLEDEFRLFGRHIAGPAGLARFCENAPLNTDDHPRVIFEAPRIAYGGVERLNPLTSLIKAGQQKDHEDTLDLLPDPSISFLTRFRHFKQARDIFLGGLTAAKNDQLEKTIDAYIESAAVSEDFTLGYAHALSIAHQTFQDNPAAAKSILQRLDKARPSRQEAREMLRRLFPGE